MKLRVILASTMILVLAAAAAAQTAGAGPAAPGAEVPETPASAAAVSAAPAVIGFRVDGLKRTRASVPQALLKRYLGAPADEALKARVAAALLDTGIFEDVRVTLPADSGGLVRVELREKWSILPIPMFSSDSEGQTYGAAVMDANAFGLNDKLFVMGAKTPGGWMAMAAYMDSADDRNGTKRSLSAGFGGSTASRSDIEDETYRRFDLSSADFLAKQALPLFPEGTPASVKLGIGFKERAVDGSYPDALESPASERVVLGSLEAEARTSSWDGVFLSERSASVGAAYSYGLVGSSYWNLDVKLAYEKPFFPGLRGVAKAAGSWAPDAPAVFEIGRREAGVAILPKTYAAPTLFGAALGLEARLAKLRFGTLSGLANWQTAFSRDGAEGDFAYGPAAGVRLYVAKVAFPAMDLSVAYNVPTGLWQAVFGIGVRM